MVEDAFRASPIHNSQWSEPLVGLLEKIDFILGMQSELEEKAFEEPLKIIARIDVLLTRIEEDEIEYDDDGLERTMLIDDNGSEGVTSREAESVPNEGFLRSFNATLTLENSEAQISDDPAIEIKDQVELEHDKCLVFTSGLEQESLEQSFGDTCTSVDLHADTIPLNDKPTHIDHVMGKSPSFSTSTFTRHFDVDKPESVSAFPSPNRNGVHSNYGWIGDETQEANLKPPMSVRIAVLKPSKRTLNVLHVHSEQGDRGSVGRREVERRSELSCSPFDPLAVDNTARSYRLGYLHLHQYTALIWMLLREHRIDIAHHVADIVLGPAYHVEDSPSNFQTAICGGVLADARGLKKASTIAALISVTAAKCQKPTLIITSDARLTLWHEILSCSPNLKAHFYTGTKARRTKPVCGLIEPKNFFEQFDVIITTSKVACTNEVDPSRADRANAWIKRRGVGRRESVSELDTGVTYLHLATFDRLVIDDASKLGTVSSKKFKRLNKFKGLCRWCLSDDAPATPRRLSAWLTFLTGGEPMSVATIAAIAAANEVREGSASTSINTIVLRRHEKDLTID